LPPTLYRASINNSVETGENPCPKRDSMTQSPVVFPLRPAYFRKSAFLCALCVVVVLGGFRQPGIDSAISRGISANRGYHTLDNLNATQSGYE
jgi:hypothetical protein